VGRVSWLHSGRIATGIEAVDSTWERWVGRRVWATLTLRETVASFPSSRTLSSSSLQKWQGRAALGLEGSIPSPRRSRLFWLHAVILRLARAGGAALGRGSTRVNRTLFLRAVGSSPFPRTRPAEGYRSSESSREDSVRGACGRSGPRSPDMARGMPALFRSSSPQPVPTRPRIDTETRMFGVARERDSVTPEVAGSSPVAPVSRYESNRADSRPFVGLARSAPRQREPPKDGLRQKNGDQNGDHFSGPRRALKDPSPASRRRLSPTWAAACDAPRADGTEP